MQRRENQGPLLWSARVALGVGLACLTWVSLVTVQAAWYDREQRDHFGEQRAQTVALTDTGRGDAVDVSGALIGILEIPRIGFSEIVAEGDDADTLRVAIGRLPDTPLPWHPGNSALAGHRDGRFRALKHVRIGDRIVLATRAGELSYILRETMIVSPADVWVLTPTRTRTLTLITCYPFSFIGSAPQRFVIKAEAVDTPALMPRTTH